ncbi:MAG: hypothetical protein P4L38_12405 [Syntrophaceae bacterium]|nr:hypothetical protein [Syntrophaceae bacterium]
MDRFNLYITNNPFLWNCLKQYHIFKKMTGFKKPIGAGTVVAAIATGGFSLAALPAYETRCLVCGSRGSESSVDTIRLQDDVLA